MVSLKRVESVNWLGYVLILIGSIGAFIGELGVLIALFKDSKFLFVLSLLIPPIGGAGLSDCPFSYRLETSFVVRGRSSIDVGRLPTPP